MRDPMTTPWNLWLPAEIYCKSRGILMRQECFQENVIPFSDRQHPLEKHVSGVPIVDDRWIHALRSTIHDPWSWSIGGIHVREMRSWWSPVVLAGDHFSGVNEVLRYRSLLASRSDSSKVRRSPSRTGPFTFLMICRFCSPKNSTFTWVHCPCEPVRPRTLITRAKTTGLSILIVSHTWIVTRTKCLAQMEEKWERSQATRVLRSTSGGSLLSIVIQFMNCWSNKLIKY